MLVVRYLGSFLFILFSGSIFAQHSIDAVPLQSIDYFFSESINQNNILKHLSILASDSLEGREFGTIGNMKAGEYIAYSLRKSKVLPFGDRGTFFQPVEIKSNYWDKLELQSGAHVLKPVIDFFASLGHNPADYQTSATYMLFAGYGIDAANYNDYAFAQGWNESLLILDGEPMVDGKYIISGNDHPSEWSSDLDKKVQKAVSRNVKCIYILTDSAFFKRIQNRSLASFNTYSFDTSYSYPIPVIRINMASMPDLLSKSELDKLYAYIDQVKNGQVASNFIQLPLSLQIKSGQKIVRGRNIVAAIPGDDPDYKNEWIVLSAHYNHLGVENGKVYNGADDNGTGTSALLELAAALQKRKNQGGKLKRSVLFLFMTGEEKGLLGSAYFVRHPIVPLNTIKSDINIDMIGRSDNNHPPDESYVYIIGSDKINLLLDKAIVSANNASVHYHLDYTYNDENHPSRLYYRSDHYNFAVHGIPSVFLFGGFHEDYHQPTDDIDKINLKKVQDISRLVYFTILRLANYPGIIETRYNTAQE
jgi:hypothetical protein